MPDAVPDRVFTGVGFFTAGAGRQRRGHERRWTRGRVRLRSNNRATGPMSDHLCVVRRAGVRHDPDLVLGSGVNQHLMNAANAGDVNADGFPDLIGAEGSRVRLVRRPFRTRSRTCSRAYASVAGAGTRTAMGSTTSWSAHHTLAVCPFSLGKRRRHPRGPALLRMIPAQASAYASREGARRRPGPSDLIASAFGNWTGWLQQWARLRFRQLVRTYRRSPADAGSRPPFVGPRPNPASMR